MSVNDVAMLSGNGAEMIFLCAGASPNAGSVGQGSSSAYINGQNGQVQQNQANQPLLLNQTEALLNLLDGAGGSQKNGGESIYQGILNFLRHRDENSSNDEPDSGEDTNDATESSAAGNGSYNLNDPNVKAVFSNTKKVANIQNHIDDLGNEEQQALDSGNDAKAAAIEKKIDKLTKEQNLLLFETNLDLQQIMKTEGASAESGVEHQGNAISEGISGGEFFNYDQSDLGFMTQEASQAQSFLGLSA